ncbi:MAG: BamA/TamA family outer membrane protein [Acidobacteriota bacterium]
MTCDAGLAQETRAAIHARKQSEKAMSLAPSRRGKAEKWVNLARGMVYQLEPRGLYPYLDSAYPGGNITAGLGYRGLYGDTGSYDIRGLWSVENYRMIEASLKLPEIARGRLTSVIHAKHLHADKVAFYGIGNDSPENERTNYKYAPEGIGLTETLAPVRWLSAGGSIAFTHFDVGGNLFSSRDAPAGLHTDPDYLIGSVFAQVDTRRSPGYTQTGTLFRAEWFHYDERTHTKLDFRRVDVEANQFIPVLRGNQIIALRAMASFTSVEDGDRVPFFLMPMLGGGSYLRGFGDFRFRDRHRLLFSAEYRWTPSKFMDMALSYDAGMVASRSSDFRLDGFHDCVGVGARFHTPSAVLLRIDLAYSVEGPRIIFSSRSAF